jgi:hypothetical protein
MAIAATKRANAEAGPESFGETMDARIAEISAFAVRAEEGHG